MSDGGSSSKEEAQSESPVTEKGEGEESTGRKSNEDKDEH